MEAHKWQTFFILFFFFFFDILLLSICLLNFLFRFTYY